MNRAEILDTAKQCVCTDRQSQYGTPEDSFNTIGRLWEDYLSAKGQRVDLKPHDVAAMMALLKIARNQQETQGGLILCPFSVNQNQRNAPATVTRPARSAASGGT